MGYRNRREKQNRLACATRGRDGRGDPVCVLHFEDFAFFAVEFIPFDNFAFIVDPVEPAGVRLVETEIAAVCSPFPPGLAVVLEPLYDLEPTFRQLDDFGSLGPGVARTRLPRTAEQIEARRRSEQR